MQANKILVFIVVMLIAAVVGLGVQVLNQSATAPAPVDTDTRLIDTIGGPSDRAIVDQLKLQLQAEFSESDRTKDDAAMLAGLAAAAADFIEDDGKVKPLLKDVYSISTYLDAVIMSPVRGTRDQDYNSLAGVIDVATKGLGEGMTKLDEGGLRAKIALWVRSLSQALREIANV